MARTRVLVVDDSQTVRKRLVEILAGDPRIEVIGEAEDGKQAIEICLRSRPDVISMDMAMPVMSGVSATEYIMAHCPTPILIVSASTNRGELFKIYDALAAGAVDVLEKPLDCEPDSDWQRHFLATVKLVARIRVITHMRARLKPSASALAPIPKWSDPPRGRQKYDIVTIGASTGGPGAIATVLRALPREFNLPVLVVLHLNAPFATAFADWLSSQIQRPVVHAEDGASVAATAGRVVLAPGDRHLLVRDRRMRLTLDPERHSCRPSVDVLFESVAAEYGASAAACLLTGMGRDGALGLLRIREAGGLTIAQDQETSVVYGMPREAAELGAAQQILAVGEIGARLGALQGIATEACP